MTVEKEREDGRMELIWNVIWKNNEKNKVGGEKVGRKGARVEIWEEIRKTLSNSKNCS